MKNRFRITGLSLFAVLVIVSGCGQKGAEMTGQSFGSIVSNVEAITSSTPSNSVSPKETPSEKPIVTPSPSTAVPDIASSPTSETSLLPKPSPQVQVESSKSQPALASPKPTEISQSTETKIQSKPTEPVTTPKSKQPQMSNEIKWAEFFDTVKQDTPSNKFWDLNGKTVQIKGFMGEVLSFDKHWFLLIPQPGAECPFDNGDETYWNKIMIVYVPDSMKLRYTSGPLLITGKLDVGIKLDESGYKTMFRLYDASFEKIKE